MALDSWKRFSDLAQYCQLCGKVAEVTLGSDFTHTIVNLSISQLPLAVRKSTGPDQGVTLLMAAPCHDMVNFRP